MSNEGTTIFRAWLNNVVQLARFLSFRWALFLGRIWRRLCQASLCGQREASNFLVNYFCKKYIFLKCKPTSEVLTNAIFIKKIGCKIAKMCEISVHVQCCPFCWKSNIYGRVIQKMLFLLCSWFTRCFIIEDDKTEVTWATVTLRQTTGVLRQPAAAFTVPGSSVFETKKILPTLFRHSWTQASWSELHLLCSWTRMSGEHSVPVQPWTLAVA